MPSFRLRSPGWVLLVAPVVLLAAWFALARRGQDSGADYTAEASALLAATPAPATSGTRAGASRGTTAAGTAPTDADAPPLAPDTSATAASEPLPPTAEVPEAVPGSPEPELDAALYSEWTTYDEALRQSRASGRPVLLAFHADWSEACLALKREVLDHVAAGVTMRAAVIPVLLTDRTPEDGANAAEFERLQRQYQIRRYPAMVVFSPATSRMRRQQGWHGSAQTLQWIIDAAAAVK